MTDAEFDNTRFGTGDEIVVRRYFDRRREDVRTVDFDLRTVNGYKPAAIIKHIKSQAQ